MSAVPRLAFVGVGWIGQHRMRAILEAGTGRAAVIADPDPTCLENAAVLAPDAARAAGIDEVWNHDIDGVVLATPSALHASQTIACLERGLAVFCQKPLARSGAEARSVVAAAERADRLLGLDLSYRQTAAMQAINQLVGGGELGRLYALDLVFHNAYGPDKPWFYDRRQSGGGCVMDLGVHLIDLALWLTGFPEVKSVASHLVAGGRPIASVPDAVEDYASIQLWLDGDVSVRVGCSWNLPAGRDAVIGVTAFGSEGGACLRNVSGSFFDFCAERFSGTQTVELTRPPDDWGGRAAASWASQLGRGAGFDSQAWQYVQVAGVLDRIYREATSCAF